MTQPRGEELNGMETDISATTGESSSPHRRAANPPQSCLP